MFRFAAALATVVALAAASAAQARKPIVAYVDATTHKLAMYDADTGTALTPPDITITSTPGFQDSMAMSFDGRYVFYVGSDDKLHLFDRTGAGTAVSLPGIDIYAKPTGLTVSNTGLLAFDDNVNGPAVVYNSATGSFLDVGLPDPNADRQSHLSGDGHFLATTCNGNAMTCPADNGGHAEPFVQDIPGATDTALPFGLGGGLDDNDKEHPCINGDGSLVGFDVNEGGVVGKQIELYDRTGGALLSITGLNSANDDTHCVLDASGSYIGLITNNNEFEIFDRAAGAFLTLPDNIKAIFNPVSFVAPFPPPAGPGGGGPGGGSSTVPDTTKPKAGKSFKKRYGLAGALAHGLLGRVKSNEDGTASATATISAGSAKHFHLAKNVKVASGKAKLRAGRSAKLRLKFTRKAKRRLAHARRVALTIAITVKDAAGNATRLRVKTTLKR
ncbi:MAG TPA: hypothetical protein VH817_23180 [Thermoleophilaceae bacterium]